MQLLVINHTPADRVERGGRVLHSRPISCAVPPKLPQAVLLRKAIRQSMPVALHDGAPIKPFFPSRTCTLTCWKVPLQTLIAAAGAPPGIPPRSPSQLRSASRQHGQCTTSTLLGDSSAMAVLGSWGCLVTPVMSSSTDKVSGQN